MSDWIKDQIHEALSKGKRPQITLFPGTEIVVPKRKRGRPRIYPEGTPRYFRYPGLHGRARPYCIAKRCTTLLRINQKAVCSPECAASVFNQAIRMLKLVDATPEEILAHFTAMKPYHAHHPASPEAESQP